MSEPYTCRSAVVQNSYEQMTGTLRTQLLSSAITYVNTRDNRVRNEFIYNKVLSSADYLAYKKAQLLSQSKPQPRRPIQTVIITELQAYGLPLCPKT